MATPKIPKEVILSNPLLGEKPFATGLAERILRFHERTKKPGWSLYDKTLAFKDGKIVPTADTGSDTDSEKQGQN